MSGASASGPESQGQVATRAIRGAAWSIVSSIAARALGLVGTMLIVRWIDPDDYGVVSAASVVVLSANQFSTLGVGIYLIAHPKAGRSAAFHGTVIHVTLGLVALAMVMALSGVLGPLFDAPTLSRFVPWLAFSVLLDRLSFVPEKVLVRDMRFRLVSIARTVGEVTYTGVSVGTAIAGWGGWSIVAGNVARSLVRTVLLIAANDRRDWLEIGPIDLGRLREMAGYGVTVSIGGVASFASRRWDNLLVSRYFGPAVMGAYNLAYNLADIPAVQVGEQITDVLLSSFANMEAERRRAILVRAVRLLGLVMFPLAVGLGLVAPTIVHVFFKRKWADVAPMLVLLSALSVPRPIGMALSNYLQAHRRPRMVTLIEIANTAVLMAAIATVGRISPLWTCATVGVVFTLRALVTMFVLRASDGISVASLLGSQLPPAIACLPMAGAVLGVRWLLAQSDHDGTWYALLAEVAAGGVAYAGAALLVARQASRELFGLLRRTRGG